MVSRKAAAVLMLIALLSIAAVTQIDWITQIKNKPFADPREYNFPAQSPGGSLIVGGNTITLRPVPLGVSGTHTASGHLPHLLYISGGTGTAEACPITGGTATPGASTGTVILNCGFTHSGAWTIKSATSGIQEAIYAVSRSDISGISGAVRIPAGTTYLYGTVTVPDGYNVSIRGQGISSTFLRTKFTTGDAIVYDYFVSGGYVDTGDYFILDDLGVSHTTGAMLRVRYRTDGLVSNINLAGAYDGYVMERNARTLWTNINGGVAHYGLYVTCAGVDYPACANEGSVLGGHITANSNAAQPIRIEAPTSGLVISEMFTEGGSFTSCISVVLAAVGTNPFNELKLISNLFDGCGSGVAYIGNSSSYVGNYIMLQNNEINTSNTGVFLQNFVQNVSILGNTIGAIGGVGTDRAIVIGGNVRNVLIFGNSQINSDGDAAILTQGTTTNIDIVSNSFGVQSQPTACLSFGGTTTHVNVRSNNFLGNAGVLGCTNIVSGSVTSLSWGGNTGSIAFPLSAFLTCGAGQEGQTAPISDSSTAVWGANIAGSGANHVQGYCNGSNYTVAAK